MQQIQIHIVKSFHNEFFMARMTFEDMIKEFGMNMANEIMLSRNIHYYIETSYYESQGKV